MAKNPTFVTSGTEAEKIDVRLSYRIVRLFSEGLYASANKAIEELVANAFDAGALRVAVFLPPDFHEQAATIAVLDDGEGMDAGGLKQHWLIGKSLKRNLAKLPRDRQQIGQFGSASWRRTCLPIVLRTFRKRQASIIPRQWISRPSISSATKKWSRRSLSRSVFES
jgi:hypothetical protein